MESDMRDHFKRVRIEALEDGRGPVASVRAVPASSAITVEAAFKCGEEEGEDDDDLMSRDQLFADKKKKPCSVEALRLLMINVTPDGGVKKRVLKPGLDDGLPMDQAYSAMLHYESYLPNCVVPFDSTCQRGRPELHCIDQNTTHLLPGMWFGIMSMKVRERAQFLVSADYAFGHRGCPPRIPADATIEVIIEVLANSSSTSTWSILATPARLRNARYSFEQVEKAVLKERLRGNDNFRDKEFLYASRCYQNALWVAMEIRALDDAQELRVKDLLLTLRLNLGLSLNNEGKNEAACLQLQEALVLDPNCGKAHYQLAKAKLALGNLSQALQHFCIAGRLCPRKSISDHICLVKKLLNQERAIQAALCRKMMRNEDAA